jgi:ketosteroid isomerase-like protein
LEKTRSEFSGKEEISMSTEKNVQIVKDFFAAIGGGDKQRILGLVAEDIEYKVLTHRHPCHASS